MATQMKDDERRLLGAAQSAGRIVPVDGMTDGRLSQLRGKWTRMKLLDADGNLTGKGTGASGGVAPAVAIEESVVLEPFAPDVVEDTEDVTVCEPEDFDNEEYDDA